MNFAFSSSEHWAPNLMIFADSGVPILKKMVSPNFLFDSSSLLLGPRNVSFSPSLLLIQPYQFYAKCLIIVAKIPFPKVCIINIAFIFYSL